MPSLQQSILCFLYQCLLFCTVESLTAFSYTTSSVAPSSVTCNDATGCEVNCDGNYACDQSTMNFASASYVTITAAGDYVLQDTNIYCPANAQCTISTIGASALSGATIHCGTDGTCDISAGGSSSWSGVNVYADSSTKLIAAADGGYNSFNPNLYCPRNKPTPSCIIKIRSDSSPYWTQGPIMTNIWIFVDAANELEFQCDAISQWSALFGSGNDIYYHGDTKKAECLMELASFSSSDFFATNVLDCGPSSAIRTFLDGIRCVPWSTDSPTNNPTPSPTDITQIPTTSPTIYPTKYPTNIPTVSPTLPPVRAPTSETVSPSQAPSNFPSLSPVIMPTLSPSQAPSKYPTLSPINAPTLSPTSVPTENPSSSTLFPSKVPSNAPVFSASPSQIPTMIPSFSPTQSTIFPTRNPTIEPTTKQPTTAPITLPDTLFPTEMPITMSSYFYISTEEDDISNNSNTEVLSLTDSFPFWVFLCITVVIVVFCVTVCLQYKKDQQSHPYYKKTKKTNVREPGFANKTEETEANAPVVRGPGFSITNEVDETFPSQNKVINVGADDPIALSPNFASIHEDDDDDDAEDRYWDICFSCGEYKKGKIFGKDGLFFCDGCWEFQNSAMYEHGVIGAADIAPAPQAEPQHVEMSDVAKSSEQKVQNNVHDVAVDKILPPEMAEDDREQIEAEKDIAKEQDLQKEAQQEQKKENRKEKEEEPEKVMMMNRVISLLQKKEDIQQLDDESDRENDENTEQNDDEKREPMKKMGRIISVIRGKEKLQELSDESDNEESDGGIQCMGNSHSPGVDPKSVYNVEQIMKGSVKMTKKGRGERRSNSESDDDSLFKNTEEETDVVDNVHLNASHPVDNNSSDNLIKKGGDDGA